MSERRVQLWSVSFVVLVSVALVSVVRANPVYVRGDVNADGKVGVEDAMGLLGYLFTRAGAVPPCVASADANDDGSVNIGDAVYLLGYFFANRAAPAFPYPECGSVKGAVELSCGSFSPCEGLSVPAFQPYAGNPILRSRSVGAKRIYKVGPEEYRMWFVENQTSVYYPVDFHSDFLVSRDGLSWDPDGIHRNAISTAQSGLRFNYDVTEVKEGGIYRAWHDATDNDSIAFTDLYYSTSTDGVNFTGHGMVMHRELAAEWRNIFHPVIVGARGACHLFYTVDSGDGISRIAYARGEPGDAKSADGLTWTKYGVVIDLGPEGSVDVAGACIPVVLAGDTRFEMFYSGFDGQAWGVAYAVSDDGITWKTLGPVEGVLGFAAGAIKEDGVYKIWSTHYPERGVFELHYAESVK